MLVLVAVIFFDADKAKAGDTVCFGTRYGLLNLIPAGASVVGMMKKEDGEEMEKLLIKPSLINAEQEKSWNAAVIDAKQYVHGIEESDTETLKYLLP